MEIKTFDTESSTVVTVGESFLEGRRRYVCPKGTFPFAASQVRVRKEDNAVLVTFDRKLGRAPRRFLMWESYYGKGASSLVGDLLPFIEARWGLSDMDFASAFIGATLSRCPSDLLDVFGSRLLGLADSVRIDRAAPADEAPGARLTFEDLPAETDEAEGGTTAVGLVP